MFTPWTVCLPSCSSKCICRCALRPSRAMWSQTRWKYRQKRSQTSANLYDLPAFCRCTVALFSIFHGEAESLSLTHRLRSDQEVKALSYGMWSVLPAGSEQHWHLFSHTESQPLNLLTKMRQTPDLSFVPNIPILKITCFTIKVNCLCLTGSNRFHSQ